MWCAWCIMLDVRMWALIHCSCIPKNLLLSMVPMIRQVAAVNIEANMSELLQGESVPCEEENNCGAKQQKNQSLKETIDQGEKWPGINCLFMHNHSQENLRICLCLEIVGKIDIYMSDTFPYNRKNIRKSIWQWPLLRELAALQHSRDALVVAWIHKDATAFCVMNVLCDRSWIMTSATAEAHIGSEALPESWLSHHGLVMSWSK